MFRLLLWMMMLQGCTSTAVRCDAHLVPINAPAEKVGQSDVKAGAP